MVKFFRYCICQHNYTLIDEPRISLRIAEQAVEIINHEISLSEYKNECAHVTVDREKTTKMHIQEFDSQGKRRIFRASFRVSPSGGLYDAFAEVELQIIFK